VHLFVADLSAQSEVRRLAEEVLQQLPRVDVLLNKAGGYWNTRHVTADGLEHTFAVNHLAPYRLTHLLLNRLMRSGPARVVTVSSNAQALGRIHFDDLQGARSYSGARAYDQSKLANVLFTYEPTRPTSWPAASPAPWSPPTPYTLGWSAPPSEPKTPVISNASSSRCSGRSCEHWHKALLRRSTSPPPPNSSS
jgi:hypothetical protein